MWIKAKSNSVWVRPESVAAVAGKGLSGDKGSVIHLAGGQNIETLYPVTQLVAMLGLSE